MKYMFAMGVEQVLTKYKVKKLQTWAAWPVFQIKEPKCLKLPRVSSHPELRYIMNQGVWLNTHTYTYESNVEFPLSTVLGFSDS